MIFADDYSLQALVQWQNMAVCEYNYAKIAITQNLWKIHPVKIKAYAVDAYIICTQIQ